MRMALCLRRTQDLAGPMISVAHGSHDDACRTCGCGSLASAFDTRPGWIPK